MKKIKLTLFEDKFGVGGIETFIYNICSHLDREKYDIRIVVVNKITNYYDDLLKSLGVRLIVLVPKIELNPLKRFKMGLPAFNDYLKKEENMCDIMHFNLSDSIDLLYVKVARKNGVKRRVVHSHNSSATSLSKKIVHYIGKIFLDKEPNYYLACSSQAAKWLFPKKVYRQKDYLFVRNAIDANKYKFNETIRKSVRKKYKWNNNVIYGEVARFNKQKNHKFLLEIFQQILRRQPSAKLVLVGEGELLPDLKKQVSEIGLSNSVIFLGVSNNVPNLLQAFDVFMLPSLYEGLPFVLVESQAASLPALVSDSVTKEVDLTNYLTYFSLKSSPTDWAKMALRLSKQARHGDSILDNTGFNIDVMVKTLDDFYNDILN